MYGMENKSISTTVIKRYGQEQWRLIANQFDFDTEVFVEMQPYSDEITFGIVGKCVEVLGVDAGTFLEELGRNWVMETAQGSYKNMYSLVQGGLFEFIANLNNMHQVISAQMPDLIPPSFLCEKDPEGNIKVVYFSERAGLQTFVKGLLHGLCEKFDEGIDVVIVSEKSEQQPFDEFKILMS